MKRTLLILSAFALSASLLSTAAVIRQHAVLTFGAVNGLPDPALDPRPIGLAINVALEQYPDLNPVLDSLSAFQWLRQTFPWDKIEPGRGTYAWALWDEIVARGLSRQKKFIAVLNGSPAWEDSSASARAAAPVSPTDFANFAFAFATRYADKIDVYQIWDEPNILTGWGNRPPSAADYAALLQAAYTAIHAADPTATVLAAGLAPNTETGPDNYSDLLYLQQLYDLGANKYFDAASGKPYGYYTGPADRAADPALINFSRFTLLRQVMERNGDSHKLLWASNFGWNMHPASQWGIATPEQQRDYTLAAYQRALAEWPWAGPLALENYQPGSGESKTRPYPSDDPHWGFALFDSQNQPSLLAQALRPPTSDLPPLTLIPGNYPAHLTSIHYSGDWQFSDLGADIPQSFETARIEFTFQGAALALQVRRADYRAYLYVTVDGQPANLLPRDERGAYLVLTSPDLRPQINTLPVASGLLDGVHTVLIQPDRGWNQWAIVGFSVGHQLPTTNYLITLLALISIACLSLISVLYFGRQLNWGNAEVMARAQWERLGSTGQLILTALVGGLLYITSWLTFGNDLIAISRRFGDTLPIVVTALTAGLFYFSPSFLLASLALVALFVLFYLRLDLALAFTALFIPFYLQPRLLWQRGTSLVEFATLLTLAAWLLQNSRPLLESLKPFIRNQKAKVNPPSAFRFLSSAFSSLDLALLALALFAIPSVMLADLPGVALRDYRLVILEPVIFYFILRHAPLDSKQLWRIVDFFILGAVIVAGIGLYQYVTQTDLITAEGGVLRIRSVYGSPNNLALYLGRAFPIALTVAVMGGQAASGKRQFAMIRPILYGVATALMGLTMVLTFSKGALFLGLPIALAVILSGWLGRKGWLIVGGGAAASLAALPFLSRIPRFADLLNPASGTSFFRTKLWLSAWRMFADHPLFGVGPDNFLYQYRSKYILPEAWQEPNLSHPHNIFLDHLSRLGLFGFACGLWLQIGFWKLAVNTYKRLQAPTANFQLPTSRSKSVQSLALCLGLMASVADMLAHGLVDNSFFLVDLAYAFCLTLALMQHLHRLSQAD